jgi:hypothetical protein
MTLNSITATLNLAGSAAPANLAPRMQKSSRKKIRVEVRFGFGMVSIFSAPLFVLQAEDRRLKEIWSFILQPSAFGLQPIYNNY